MPNDYFDRYVSATAPFDVNGTCYDLRQPDPGATHRSLEGGALERAFVARNIARCCDGDDHAHEPGNLTRYNSTIADAERWAAWLDA